MACTRSMVTALVLAASIFVFFLFGPSLTLADSISTTARIDHNVPGGGTATVDCQQSGTTSAVCQSTLVTPLSGSGTAAAQGSLSSGFLGAESAATTGNKSTTVLSVGYGQLIYDFAIGNGPAGGNLMLSLTMNGTTQLNPACSIPYAVSGGGLNSCGSIGFAAVSIPTSETFLGAPSNLILPNSGMGTVLYLPSGTTPFQIETPYSSGTATFSVFMEADSQCRYFDTNPDGTCSASSNYFDTLQINGATVLDANGSVVPGATVTDSSGFNPVAAPEPPTLLMLAGGLIALVGFAKREVAK